MFSPSNGQMLGLLSVIINALKEFVSSIGGSFFKAIYDIIMWAYYYVCRSIYSAFLLPIARVIDICQLIFRKFAGIDQMKIENLNRSQIFGSGFQSDDIVANLISSSIVQRIFFAMLILAVILIVVTTFVANIKSEFNAQDKGSNNKTKIFKNAFRGLLNFVAVPVISLFAIFLSNGLLQAIAGATQVNGDDVYLSGQLFVASAYNANRARSSEYYVSDDKEVRYKPKSFGALITGGYESGKPGDGGYANFGIFLDDEGDYGLRAADKIDNAFAKGLSITLTDSSNATKLYYGDKLDFWFAGGVLDVIGNVVSMVASAGGTMPGGFTAFPEGYKGGWAGSDFNQSEGIYELDFVNNKADEADSGHISFSIYDTALVFYYYDLSLDSFGYVTYIIAGAYFCYALLVTVVGLIKRLFMVTTLFIISPPVCALYPIDEGKALERWRKAFISEVTSAYAVVVVMNIFLSLLPLFASIQVFNYTTISPRMFQLFPMYTWWVDPNTYSVDAGSLFVQNVFMSPVVDALNAFAKLLIMIGGMHFFSKAVKAIAEILGTGNAMQDGAEVAGKLAKTIGGATTLAVGAGAMMAKRASARRLAKNNAYIDRMKDAEQTNGSGSPQSEQEPSDGKLGQSGAPNPSNGMGTGGSGSPQPNSNNGIGETGGDKKPSTQGDNTPKPQAPRKGFYERFVGFSQRFNVLKNVATGKAGVSEVNNEFKEFKAASQAHQANRVAVKNQKPLVKKYKKLERQANRERRNILKQERMAEHNRLKGIAFGNRFATDSNFAKRVMKKRQKDIKRQAKQLERQREQNEKQEKEEAKRYRLSLEQERNRLENSISSYEKRIQKLAKEPDRSKLKTALSVKLNETRQERLQEARAELAQLQAALQQVEAELAKLPN